MACRITSRLLAKRDPGQGETKAKKRLSSPGITLSSFV
jgi:hypothetical protein